MLHPMVVHDPETDAQVSPVDSADRRRLNGHGSAVLWLTGLSGAGKTTLAHLLQRRLHAAGCRACVLDGDQLRRGLCRDLGFSRAERSENIRRAAEVARLMSDAGLIVIAAFISPYRTDRQQARQLMADGEFIEVHVDVPLAVAEQRDPKGLYRRARRGELPQFTGIDAPYEAPQAPELRLDTAVLAPDDAVDQLHALLVRRGVVAGG